jgi:CRISPR/Cas system-associated exonuclease Cas4 (RecB family)
VDYKTGKPSADHVQQLELYAATALILYPEAEIAVCADWYLDNGPHSSLEYVLARSGLEKVLDKWTDRVRVMETDTIFPARPGRHCSYCAFSKKKGGQCQFG